MRGTRVRSGPDLYSNRQGWICPRGQEFCSLPGSKNNLMITMSQSVTQNTTVERTAKTTTTQKDQCHSRRSHHWQVFSPIRPGILAKVEKVNFELFIVIYFKA